MPLSWNEIKDRALAFSKEWADESSEDAEAKSFWDGFFTVFGVPRRRVATFEEPVKKGDAKQGYIDLLWKGQILVEHKSRGKDLDRAFQQAKDYFPGLKDRDLPKYVLVSDFARFRLYDLEERTHEEFVLADLYKNVRLFGFIAGYQKHEIKPQDPINVKAVETLGKLHDALYETGYSGHPLEVLLVRLLFCLFAEDTSIFEKQQFQDFIESRTAEDGSDLGSRLSELFYYLDVPEADRSKALDETVAAFPYVNGRLFEEKIPPAAFTRKMRDALLECCALDWSRISPAIFGSLFQSVMSKEKRREQGAHYTTEENILKLIKPLFMDELREEFEKVKSNKTKLEDFHQKLANLTFLDPACGCGNFLVIAYREIRKLELEILKKLHGGKETGFLDAQNLVWCDVDKFFGIELDEFPARIAEVAMWLMDHQMNLAVSEAFGQYFRRLPLKKAATIVHGNALRIDWGTVIPPKALNYILGNPPFGGHHYQSAEQKTDQQFVMHKIKARGVLDYVCNWYIKSSEFVKENSSIQTAFVSTNSITQGEQVGILWSELLSEGIKIQFAHRTFQWNSEARGKAAVHCVIVGFAKEMIQPSPPASPDPLPLGSAKWERGKAMRLAHSPLLFSRRDNGRGWREAPGEGRLMTRKKLIFDYETPKSEPHAIEAKNINPYLIDGTDTLIINRSEPLANVPRMIWGNKPTDGGHLILSLSERDEILAKDPGARKYIRKFIGAEEMLYGEERYCLWLVDAKPDELKQMPSVMKRIDAVRYFRASSKAATTRAYADRPTLFRQVAQPKTTYLAVPEVSSERRNYLPIAFISPDVICSNRLQVVPDATRFHFGVISSSMHIVWMRQVCGRLENRYIYSNTIVYNNFPWPSNPSDKAKAAIEAAAQGVLDARAAHPGASLADLYDPLTMPADLLKAHHALDRAVDAAYGSRKFTRDADRVAFLFERYLELTKAPLEAATIRSNKKRATK